MAYAFIYPPAPLNPPCTGVTVGNLDIVGIEMPSIENSPDPGVSTRKEAVAAVALATVARTTLPAPRVAVAGTVVVMVVPVPLMVNGVALTVPILTEVTLDSAVPVMVTAAPTGADAGVMFVMVGVGSAAALTVKATACVAMPPEIVKLVVPTSANSGIPHKSPRLGLSAAQSGSTPALTVHPPADTAWEAVNWWQYATPGVAAGGAALVMV